MATDECQDAVPGWSRRPAIESLDNLVVILRYWRTSLDRLVNGEAMTQQGNTPFLTGTLELIVLQLLQAEPTNGYDLTLRIQAISRDVLNVNAGSLYPALYRLEQRGLLKASWATSDTGRRTKVYSVTAAGHAQLAEQRADWERFAGALTAILAVS